MAIFGKKKKVEEAVEPEGKVPGELATPEPEQQGAPASPTEAASGVVTVSWNGGTREYSRAIHGENFIELAKQFAGQYPEATIA